MPEGAEQGIVKCMYLYQRSSSRINARVQILGSGTILRKVIAVSQIFEVEYSVVVDIWIVTSFNELI